MRIVFCIITLFVCNVFTLSALSNSSSDSHQVEKKKKLFVLPDTYKKYTLSFGDPNAPIKIHKFFSFSCTSCMIYHKHHFPIILDEYINSGKVYWTLVPYVMDVDTLYVMAATSECSDEIKRKAFDCILEKAMTWTDDDNKETIIQTLKDCGLSEEDIQLHLSEANYEHVLRESFDFQEYITLDGTPTLFMNGVEIPGVPNSNTLKQMISEALSAQTKEDQ